MKAGVGMLDEGSGYNAIMAEVARQCTLHGDAEAANFYSWDESGLWRVQDRSEPRPMVLGSNTPDMQRRVEIDVAEYVRLRRRRAAIGGEGEPVWSMAIDSTVRMLLDHVGVDPAVARDDDEPCGQRGDIRVDNVTHARGRVLSWIGLGTLAGSSAGGAVRLESYLGSVNIRIEGFRLPDTAMTAVVGMPLRTVMPHPLLDLHDLVIAATDVDVDWHGTPTGTMFVLEPRWEPVIAEHDGDRSWLMPGPCIC